MMNPIKKIKIEDRILDVIPFDHYSNNAKSFEVGYNAVQINETVYPLRNKTDTRPGVYNYGPISKFVPPTDDEDKKEYSSNNIIDFQKASNIRDVIEKKNKLLNMERTILTTFDNKFIPEVKENDTPIMAAMKEAVAAKNCDIDKYDQRFGSTTNFQNHKREFLKNNMSLGRVVSTANALDMKVTIIIEDANENVPNPMGIKVVKVLTGGDYSEEE